MRGMQAKAQENKDTSMIIRLACLIAVAAILAGCETDGSDPQMRPSVQATEDYAASAANPPPAYMQEGYVRAIPPMEEGRKVNEQSCTEGVALAAGNLKCK
jgi:hypothetical protein